MAGIQSALRRVAENKNIGVVQVIDSFQDDDGRKAKFAIIKLQDKALITQYDWGTDIRISDLLKSGDQCILMIIDNWTAEWRPMSNGMVMGVDMGSGKDKTSVMKKKVSTESPEEVLAADSPSLGPKEGKVKHGGVADEPTQQKPDIKPAAQTRRRHRQKNLLSSLKEA